MRFTTADATPERIDQATLTALSIEPRSLRADVLAALEVFASNVFNDVDWAARMPEELLMESNIYTRGLEKGEAIGLEKGEAIGLEKGEAIGLEKGLRKLLALQIRMRFPVEADGLISKLGALDEQRLTVVGELLADPGLQRDQLAAALAR